MVARLAYNQYSPGLGRGDGFDSLRFYQFIYILMSENNFNDYKQVLDSFPDQVAVIDDKSTIVFVNQAWTDFYVQNGGSPDKDWFGSNYIECCNVGDAEVRQSVEGIRSVIDSKQDQYYYEYPCHSLTEQRWFMMRVTPLNPKGQYYIISHVNVTERKLAEIEVLKLAMVDPLTKIANRRRLDEILTREWNSCIRYGEPLSVMMIDIDNFKKYNDHFGHIQGDTCLKQVADCIQHSIRQVDTVARFGGEEFLVVLPRTPKFFAELVAARVLTRVRQLAIEHVTGTVTVSIGVTSVIPTPNTSIEQLIHTADQALYVAKRNGKNTVVRL